MSWSRAGACLPLPIPFLPLRFGLFGCALCFIFGLHRLRNSSTSYFLRSYGTMHAQFFFFPPYYYMYFRFWEEGGRH